MEGRADVRPKLRLRVDRIDQLRERIKAFELSAVDDELPRFEAGAHLDILTGNGVVRSYSLANDPAETHRYVIAVLREPFGVGSGWMHDRVSRGDVLEVLAPQNAFALEESAAEHLLIAGGIGITPIRAMAYRLATIAARFRLLYCTRSPEDTAFNTELREMFGERVVIHHDGGDPARSFDLKALLEDRTPGAHVYVCGPRGMIEAARQAAAHWPDETVHYEIFASPAPDGAVTPTHAAGDVAFEVELRRSGKVITVGADQTILDAMLAVGVRAPHVCKEGWCGNCQLMLLEGRADHRDEVLSEEEKLSNTLIHTCVSRAAPGETRLVIDR